MPSAVLESLRTQSFPSRVARVPHAAVGVAEPARVAAFVFELEALYDPAALARARARAWARNLARVRGLDPLWTEVLALDLACRDHDDALATLATLAGEAPPRLEPAAIDGARIASDADLPGIFARLRHRFKVAVVSHRPATEAHAILGALGLDGLTDATAFDSEAAAACATAVARLDEPGEVCVLVAASGSAFLGTAVRAGLRTVSIGLNSGPRGYPATDELRLRNLILVEALAAGADAKYGDAGRFLRRR